MVFFENLEHVKTWLLLFRSSPLAHFQLYYILRAHLLPSRNKHYRNNVFRNSPKS